MFYVFFIKFKHPDNESPDHDDYVGLDIETKLWSFLSVVDINSTELKKCSLYYYNL